jgi:hypothetical protein
MPIANAGTLASPATDPDTATAVLEVARVGSPAPTPARATTTSLAMNTAFQAPLCAAQWNVERFQNPVTIRMA